MIEPQPERLLAYLGNGHIGLRVGRIPLLDGVAMINGYWGAAPDDGIPTLVPAPYPLAGDLCVAGRWLSERPDRASFIDQALDFGTGELRSRFSFDADDVHGEVEVLTFCSRSDPALVLQEVAVRCDGDTEVVLEAAIATARAPGRLVDAGAVPDGDPPTADAWLSWESQCGSAQCGLVLAVVPELGAERDVVVDNGPDPIRVSVRTAAPAGTPVRLRTIVGLVPDLAHDRPERQAGFLVARGLARGWDALRQANRDAWAELWRARPLIDGPGEWQPRADASFFYLHSSISRASLAGTGVFGLAHIPNYHAYRGHVMWDIEALAFPPLVLSDPDAARAVLGFRSRTAAAARTNAALHGYAGLQYPWEADFAFGQEATPRWSKQDKDHVSLDIGNAFCTFAAVSGDSFFAREDALPVVRGIAEWLLSRVERTRRGVEMRRVRGPAEAFEPVDNDAWVNLAAITFLRRAAALVRSLGDEPPASWETTADAFVIPRDAVTGAIVNHDAYRPGEPLGETPEAAAAFFPLGYGGRPDVEAATIRYALRHQVPRYVGTPMFSALLGVHAAWVGRRRLAADLFERGYGAFFDDPFGAPDEFPAADDRFPQASPMLANLGAFLSSLLYGLPGIRPNFDDPATWPERRVILPAGWKAIEVERLWIRGRPARLLASQGAERATLEVGAPRWSARGSRSDRVQRGAARAVL